MFDLFLKKIFIIAASDSYGDESSRRPSLKRRVGGKRSAESQAQDEREEDMSLRSEDPLMAERREGREEGEEEAVARTAFCQSLPGSVVDVPLSAAALPSLRPNPRA